MVFLHKACELRAKSESTEQNWNYSKDESEAKRLDLKDFRLKFSHAHFYQLIT